MQFIYSKNNYFHITVGYYWNKKKNHSSFYSYLVCMPSTKERETLKDSFEIKV